MEEIKMIDNLQDGETKSAILAILEKLASQLPNVFNVNMAKAMEHDDSVEVEIPTEGQKMSEYLIDDLKHKMQLNIFFVIRSENGSRYNCVLYSDPTDNNMFIVYVNSHMFGLVDSVVIEFYNSIDIMYDQLYNEYRQSKKSDGDRIEQQPIRELINKFY